MGLSSLTSIGFAMAQLHQEEETHVIVLILDDIDVHSHIQIRLW
jgi:hypothetical protein